MSVGRASQATPGLLNIIALKDFKEFNLYMDYKGLEKNTIYSFEV